MTRKQHTPRSRHGAGFSLIELLVSLAIGLIIMVAAISAYVGSAGASRMSDAQSRMNEDAQAALGILAQQIRMAGNNPDQPNRVGNANPALSSLRNPVYGTTSLTLAGTNTTSQLSMRGCDGTFTNINSTNTTTTGIDALTCVAGGTNTVPDSIAVSYEADRFNTIPTGGTSSLPTDCLGNKLPVVTATVSTIVAGTASSADVTYTVADNRYYIGTASVANVVTPSLYCKGNGGASVQMPMVENIETLQLRYGTVSTASTATTATVAGYLHATEVLTETSMALLANDAERWAKVATVRICVLVRSENPVAPNAASAQYTDCAGNLVDNPPDLRLRRAYTTTVVLRNRRL
ncbi:MAG: PilW family protein [Burkholderiales bacterium]|nr:PilW family protein [Burkholderiales bacterium]